MEITLPNSEIIPTISIIYFSSVTTALLVAKCIPQLDRFFRHGKLNLHSLNQPVPQIIHQLANLTVPKQWFAYFYHLFLILMITLTSYNWLSLQFHDYNRLIWLLLLVQAGRRTYESKYVTKWSMNSRMHFTHFFVGIVFYVLVSLIAFTGVGEFATMTKRAETITEQLKPVTNRTIRETIEEFLTSNISSSLLFSDYILAFAFLIYSLDQYQNHVHLSSLVKYTAPSIGLFKNVSCAHYFDEILIYGIVTVISMKLGRFSMQSLSFLAAWCFVVVNLSISAKETRAFYLTKFTDYSVKYSIIPYLY